MASGHNEMLRFGPPLPAAHAPAEGHALSEEHGAQEESRFRPSLSDGPPLPAIDYSLVGKKAPVLLDTPKDKLPNASAVVLCWTSAEWAALEHAFCQGST